MSPRVRIPSYPKNQDPIIAYTDGSCKNNPGIGSCAAIIYHKNRCITKSYVTSEVSTNNIMELYAVILVLQELEIDYLKSYITIYSDSSYVVNGCNEWLSSWKKNNWCNTSKKIIKNPLLWKKIDQYLGKFKNLTLLKIKAHTNRKDWHHSQNHFVDQLAYSLLPKLS